MCKRVLQCFSEKLGKSPTKNWEILYNPVIALFFHVSLPKIWHLHSNKSYFFEVSNNRVIILQRFIFFA